MEQGAAVETKVRGTEDRLEGIRQSSAVMEPLHTRLFGQRDRPSGAADPSACLEGVADDPRRGGTGPRLDEGWVSTAGGAREAAVGSARQGRKWYATSQPRGSSKLVRATLEEPAGQCERPSRDLEDAAKNPRGSSRSVRETLEGPRGRCKKSLEAPRGQCERPSRHVEVSARDPRGSSRVLPRDLEGP